MFIRIDLLLQNPAVSCFAPLQLMLRIAYSDLRLVYRCSAMEAHLMMLILMLLPAVWNSVVSVTTHDRRIYTLLSSALSSPALRVCVVYVLAKLFPIDVSFSPSKPLQLTRAALAG